MTPGIRSTPGSPSCSTSPKAPRGAYHRRRDQWTTTYGDGAGLIVYAIATERRRVLILRLVALA